MRHQISRQILLTAWRVHVAGINTLGDGFNMYFDVVLAVGCRILLYGLDYHNAEVTLDTETAGLGHYSSPFINVNITGIFCIYKN